MKLPEGILSVVKSKLTPSVARDMILLGKRYGGIEAKENGIVDKALPASRLLEEALVFAKSLSKKTQRNGVYKAMRCSLFSSAIQVLQKSKL